MNERSFIVKCAFSYCRGFVLAVITVATACGIWFVIQRHLGYYRNRDDMAVLLAREQDAPELLKNEPRRNSANSLSGVVFYISWILAGCALCYEVILWG